MPDEILKIENLTVRFDSFTLEKISLNVCRGDYMALLGLSGAGKTVLLEALAGMVKPAEGIIIMNGKDITRHAIQDRRIGLVYQDLSLFPHFTVYDNIAFPLRNQSIKKKDIKRLISDLAEKTGSSHLLHRYPGTLSGGEAQRVALARTLASNPEILLLDEPLSNLDVKLKAGLRTVLRNIHQSGKTVIHVTHDFMEAATLANKVAVVENGRLVQQGKPEEVFRHPKTEFVARFSGIKNLFRSKIIPGPQSSGLHIANIGDGLNIRFMGEETESDGYIMIPQDDIILSEEALESSALNRIQGIIKELYRSGNGVEIVVDAGEDFVVSVSRQSSKQMDLQPGKKVWLGFKASAVKYLKG